MRRTPLLFILACLAAACGPAPVEPVVVGAVAPSFALEDLEGGTVESSSLAGEPTILNFWATWCQPCKREIPVLKEFADRHDFQVVGIALDEKGAATVRPMVEQFDIDYQIVIGDQELFTRFNGYSIPYTLVLDGGGRIVSIYRGPVERQDLDKDLKLIRGATATHRQPPVAADEKEAAG